MAVNYKEVLEDLHKRRETLNTMIFAVESILNIDSKERPATAGAEDEDARGAAEKCSECGFEKKFMRKCKACSNKVCSNCRKKGQCITCAKAAD